MQLNEGLALPRWSSIRRTISGRAIARQAGWAALTLTIGFIVLWPLIQLQVRAFADGGAGFRTMAAMPNIGRVIRTTIALAVGSVLIAVPMGTLLAWSASRLTPRLKRVFSLVPLLPLVIPAVAGVTGWTFLLAPRSGYINSLLRSTPLFSHLDKGPIDAYTVPVIIAITGILLTSFVYLFVHTGLTNMGQEYEAAAAANGASPWRSFRTVVLPLLRPAIVYATGIVLLLGLGQFTAPLLLGRQEGINVLTTQMFILVQDFPVDYGLGAALGAPLLVAGVLVVVLQRYVIGDQRRFITVGSTVQFGSLSKGRRWPVVVMSVYAIVVVVLPLLAIVYVALSPFWTSSMSLDNLTLHHVKQVVFEQQFLRNAVKTSITASLWAVAIVLPLGFAAAWAMLRRARIARPLRFGTDLTASLPLGVPATLFGFGLLFAYTQAPFRLYGTTLSIVLAYVTLMIPHSMRLQLTSLIGMGDQSWEASRASGAGPLRTLLLVVIPMARQGIAAAAAIITVLLFHEFSASLMVRSASTQVMGTVLYDLWTGGLFPQVAVMALIMVVVTAIGVAIALRVGGSESLRNV